MYICVYLFIYWELQDICQAIVGLRWETFKWVLADEDTRVIITEFHIGGMGRSVQLKGKKAPHTAMGMGSGDFAGGLDRNVCFMKNIRIKDLFQALNYFQLYLWTNGQKNLTITTPKITWDVMGLSLYLLLWMTWMTPPYCPGRHYITCFFAIILGFKILPLWINCLLEYFGLYNS